MESNWRIELEDYFLPDPGEWSKRRVAINERGVKIYGPGYGYDGIRNFEYRDGALRIPFQVSRDDGDSTSSTTAVVFLGYALSRLSPERQRALTSLQVNQIALDIDAAARLPPDCIDVPPIKELSFDMSVWERWVDMRGDLA